MMFLSESTLRRGARAARTGALALSCLVIAACGGGAKPAAGSGQIVARVGDSELSVHQLDALAQRQGPAVQVGPDAARAALETLVDLELAAQAATKDGLDRDPKVVQQLELARREVLAKAWSERVRATASLPGSEDISRYQIENPALFSERRLYLLQESFLGGSADELKELKGRLAANPPVATALELLRSSPALRSGSTIARAAEDLPLVLLPRLAKLREGESLWLDGPEGARVLTVIGVRAAPLSGRQADRVTQAYLTTERQRKASRDAMAALRAQVPVQLEGRFAPAAGSAPAPAASR
jgi:EpsD family peptidyl-prolyl cis-trans isomerase